MTVSILGKLSQRAIPIFVGIATLLLLSACSTVSGGIRVPGAAVWTSQE